MHSSWTFYTGIFSDTRVVTQSRMSGTMYEIAEIKLIIRVISLDSSDENIVQA